MSNIEWWKDAVVYQIYPRSFQDTDGDGVGDLRGIIQRLDYIHELGADVIWLCPIYRSPNADNGYDISDYHAIQPEYGTMDDFEQLLAEVHRRGMRLIMDLVVNHTSDEHIWFQQSRLSRENKYRNYYIWREGINGPPNNWESWFGGSAWERDDDTGEYYLHIFHKKQPDLNWQNPDLRSEIYNMMIWWLEKGVDGFRMDVISLISKPEELPNSPGGNLSPYCINGPNVHNYLQEMNKCVLARFDIMTVGECPDITIDEAKKYAGTNRHELNMVFQFEHTSLTDGPLGKWTNQHIYLPDLKGVFERWQNGLRNEAWNCLFWGNHDQPRAVSKFGCDKGEYRERSAKMLCACLYLMQGTPYIYQGEELGLINARFHNIDEYRDIESLNAYHDLVDSGRLTQDQMLTYLACASRDNARTPIPWSNAPSAGFTIGRPWIGMPPEWEYVNAEAEISNPDSVYCFYQKILKFRKGNPLIQEGSFRLLCPEHEQIFAYIREWQDQTLHVVCNFSLHETEYSLPATDGYVLFSNYGGIKDSILRPYEVVVYQD